MNDMRSHRRAMYNLGQSPSQTDLRDRGGEPYVVNLRNAALQNNNFINALWTGKNMQLTLMSLNPKEDIGLEVHDVDQLLYIVRGTGMTKMGGCRDKLDYQKNVYENDAVLIPAGTWHNLINTGNTSMKLFSVYAPPEHPFGTVHRTKAMHTVREAAPEQANAEDNSSRRPLGEYL